MDFNLLIGQISSSLTAASMQNRVTASNIANRDSDGYVRMRMSFDAAMQETDPARATAGRGQLPTVVPDERTASLEEDLLTLSKNTINYQALTKSLSRYLSIASVIANGGRS